MHRCGQSVKTHAASLQSDKPNMIRPALQEVLPIARFPEPESLHIGVVISHRRVPIRRTMQVQVDELLQVRPYDLVCVDENNLLQVHREEHVEEEDLVRPDDALLLLLRAQPRRPLVRHELIVEVVRFREVWQEFLHGRS